MSVRCRSAAAAHLADGNPRVLCNVPNVTSLHRELAVAMARIPTVRAVSAQQRHPRQPRIFDQGTPDARVTASGFTVVERGRCFLKPFAHARMQRLVSGGTIDRQMLEGLYVLGKKFPSLASDILVNLRLQ